VWPRSQFSVSVTPRVGHGWRTYVTRAQNSTRKDFLCTRNSVLSQFLFICFARPPSVLCEEYVRVVACVCVCTSLTPYRFYVNCHCYHITLCGPGSTVGIATDYRLDGPGIEFPWGQDFPPVQTGPGAHPASCTIGIGSFPGVKSGRGVTLTTHPLLAPRSWKSRAIPLPPSGPQPGL